MYHHCKINADTAITVRVGPKKISIQRSDISKRKLFEGYIIVYPTEVPQGMDLLIGLKSTLANLEMLQAETDTRFVHSICGLFGLRTPEAHHEFREALKPWCQNT